MENQKKEGINSLQKEYADYVKKHDDEFADYLKQEWNSFEIFAGKVKPLKPKPKDIPVAKPDDLTKIPAIIKPKDIPTPVLPTPKPKPADSIRKPAEDKPNGNIANFEFYGTPIFVPYDIDMTQCNIQSINEEGVADFWNKESKTNYTPAVENLLKLKADLNLNDYAYYLLVKKFSKALYASNDNLEQLMCWFIMVRSAYGVRVAFQNTKIVLLIPAMQNIYELSYLNIDRINYYVFPSLNSGSIHTYNKDYLSSSSIINFNISSPVKLNGRSGERNFTFEFENKKYNIKAFYNSSLIDFYKDYPLVDLSVYFNAAASLQANKSLIQALKPITSTMNEITAVNFILHFVQTAFSYKTDDEQFGREKFFFADEVLYYPYSDCEDRAVLFSYLVHELLGLKVIGLNYPNHVATAVAFSSQQSGDYLQFKNLKYSVADPTYINAKVGMSMPQYKNVSPIVIELKK